MTGSDSHYFPGIRLGEVGNRSCVPQDRNVLYNGAARSRNLMCSRENFVRRSFWLLQFFTIVSLTFVTLTATAQVPLSAELQGKIDKLATDTLAQTGVP